MSKNLSNRRLIIAKRLRREYFGESCPFEKTLQQPFNRFCEGGMEELHDYEYLLSTLLELFLNDTDFQESIESFLGDGKTTFEITMLFQKLIGLMNDIKENELKLSLEIFKLETENCYTEYGLDSIEKEYLTIDVNSGDFPSGHFLNN